jgi:hypothetical protein
MFRIAQTFSKLSKMAMITMFSLISLSSIFGQGLNNDYQLDNEDLKNIFRMQGINVFKFPFELKKGEYISLSYCIYEDGIEKKCCDLIEDFQIKLGINIDHHLSRQDTTVFHRFYFMNQGDSILNINIVAPGISMNEQIDISKVEVGDFTASLHIGENLPEKKDILSFYALFPESKKYQEGFLVCATGLPPEKLVANYDFVLIFFAEKITEERVKNILEETHYKSKKTEIN